MNKAELVSDMAQKCGMTLTATREFIETLFDTIIDATAADGYCRIGGNNFKLKKVAEREGRNPNTGEALTIPAKTFVTFRKQLD